MKAVGIIGAFAGWEEVDDPADGGPKAADGPLGGLAQQRLELGERLFDRVEVGAVRRQVHAAARRPPRSPGARAARLWLDRLSMTTTSPGRSVGASLCAT